MLLIKGQIISGNFEKVIARQKSGKQIEIGELLINEANGIKILLQVSDLLYGSQISQQNLEMISGMKLEENLDIDFYEPNLRNYTIAVLKSLLMLKEGSAILNKGLPEFFSGIREISEDDLNFLSKPRNSLFLGKLRSGSKTLNVDISIDGEKALAHHILIAGTTGRGKSVLVSNLLWSIADSNYAGALVLDPHDEYYGRNKIGLKDHPNKKIVYYTSRNVPIGCSTLKINIEALKPFHFDGVIDFSDAQKQAIGIYHKFYSSKWIESIILDKKIEGVPFREETMAVVKRRLLYLLDLEFSNNQLFCNGIFQLNAGYGTISDICKHLEEGKIVVIDTSNFSGSVELLIGSLVANEVFHKYKNYKMEGDIARMPAITIVLEEAPRVLGKNVLESGGNIFSTIAREGRKFKVGLTAITQLPSLIPREILANMNTKIILGIEMKPERQAIMESAAQDLSSDDRAIASLDIGEALVSSNFLKFATPIKIPFLEDVVKGVKKEEGITKEKIVNEFWELKKE